MECFCLIRNIPEQTLNYTMFYPYIHNHFKGTAIYSVITAILYIAALYISQGFILLDVSSFDIEAIENSLTHRTATSLKSYRLVYINMILGIANLPAVPVKLL